MACGSSWYIPFERCLALKGEQILNEKQFWMIIEQSRDRAREKLSLPLDTNPPLPESSMEPVFIECLHSYLSVLSADDLIAFRNEFDKKLIESYRWDLWAIAYIIHHGCSDDYFDSFRTWTICQGSEFYSSTITDPTYVARTATPGQSLVFESTGYLPYEVFEEKSGRDLPGSGIYVDRQPIGNRWEESDLESLFPEVCKKFAFGK